MNPYYYLFYKLNQFLNNKGKNEDGAIYALTTFIGWNIIIIYANVFPSTDENSKNFNKIIIGIIVTCLLVVNFILFLNKKRVNRIMERYQKESETSKKIGTFLVILYIVVSLGLIVFI